MDTPYSTIDYLRKLAELNFTHECYQRYLEMIEPGIKSIMPSYLKDWQNVEGFVTMVMMRHMGIFKTEYSVTSIDDGAEEKYSDMCDVVEFKKVKKWTFKEKIDYLRKEGILRENSYKLLDALRVKRNKIHEMGTVFSELDLQAFSKAYSIVFYIHTTLVPNNLPKEENDRIRDMAEKWAEESLKFVNY